MSLIPDFENLDESHLHDLQILMARNVEDALIDCGAEPGEDYTLLDLFTLASPLVLARFQAENLQYTKAWKRVDSETC